MISYNIPDHIAGDTWDGITEIGITNNNNIPVDLNGAYIEMSVKESIDSPTVLFLDTDNDDIIVLTPAMSSFSIPPQIVDIPPANYIYAIRVEFSGGVTKTEVTGNWNIIKTATNKI
jgi:hypothetical protein